MHLYACDITPFVEWVLRGLSLLVFRKKFEISECIDFHHLNVILLWLPSSSSNLFVVFLSKIVLDLVVFFTPERFFY